ncbi:MAG: hypothetical protein J6B04_00905 [Clostridia bacterium]|nr:hypothetical protein [Clostridia bacterium]
MENFALLNLIKAISGLNLENKNDFSGEKRAEEQPNKRENVEERDFSKAEKQAKPSENFNYMCKVLERHEKMSNRIKRKN